MMSSSTGSGTARRHRRSKRILGHAHVSTTELYTHLLVDDVLAAHRRASPVDHL
jgi:site-specific recombinase XerD